MWKFNEVVNLFVLKKLLSLCLFLNVFISGGVAHANSVSSEHESAPSVTDLMGSQENYGVSASHPLAVEVGMEVLENGGNAADAAIAVSYTLSVVEPFGSGISGGGEMLLLPPEENEPVVYDYRVQSPSDEDWDNKESGVPGFIKGMDTIHQDYGSKPFAELISPAIDFAEDGFEVDQLLSERLIGAAPRMPVKDLPHFYPDGEPLQPGETLKQTELAETLTQIKENGPNAFYKGEIGEHFMEAVPYVDEEDLEEYEVEKPEPVKGELNEGTIYSASPPLAGIPFVQSLKLAEEININETKDNEDRFVHLMAEISRVTNNDKIKEVGDPSFNEIDVDELVSDDHTQKLADDISSSKLSTETEDDGENVNDEHTDTTHFVIVDKDGMMVSATNSLSNFFGSGDYVDGYFINNAIEYHFSSKKDSPNRYEPNKRPRSSTTPSIFINEERAIGIGSPGGGRIPSVMAQVLARHFYLDESLEDAVKAKRFYGKDGYLYVEDGFSEEVKEDMEDRGYKIQAKHLPIYFGGIQALEVNKEEGTINGIADGRRGGTWDAKDKEEKEEAVNGVTDEGQGGTSDVKDKDGDLETATTYTVQEGDFLWEIADQHQTSMDKIVNQNKLRSTALNPGQQLKIPGPSTYTVGLGDTFDKISVKLGIPMSELIQANPQIKDSRQIYPGQILNIPSKNPTGMTFMGNSSKKRIALTFDNGPEDIYTTKILDILRQKNVKATFFVLGEQTKTHPELLKQIHREGHAIGNHSWDHAQLPDLTNQQLIENIQSTTAEIEKITGVKTTLFRPPYGDIKDQQVATIHNLGYHSIMWTIDTEDWRGASAEDILSRVNQNVAPGGIVLQHTFSEPGKLDGTVEALPQIIDQLRSQGYEFVTVPTLLGK